MNSRSDCLPPAPAFGWDTELRTMASRAQYQSLNLNYPRDYEDKAQIMNGLKIAGYIPVINVIIGIARIAIMSQIIAEAEADEAHVQRNVAMHIFRGVLEILVGPLLLIVDAIKTLYDNHVAYQYLNEPISLT